MCADKNIEILSTKDVSIQVTNEEVKKEEYKKRTQIEQQEQTFPYRKNYLLSFNEMYLYLIKDYKNGKMELIKPKLRTECKYRYLIRTFPEEYERCDSLTDHYVEDVRIDAYENNKMSPRQAWNEMMKSKDRERILGMKIRDQREEVYKKSRGCNLFNVSFGISIFDEGSESLHPSRIRNL